MLVFPQCGVKGHSKKTENTGFFERKCNSPSGRDRLTVHAVTISLLQDIPEIFPMLSPPQIVNVPTAQKSAFCNDFLRIQVRVPLPI